MFPFKKPPSRAEVAKKVVSDAAHSVADSVADVAATLSDKAHDLLQGAALESHVAGAAEKLGALKAGAVGSAALAGKAVADKVAAIREPNLTDSAQANQAAEEVFQTTTMPDVEAARARTQSQIDTMNKEAEKYKRELEKELARQQKFYRDESARLRDEHENLPVEPAPKLKKNKDVMRVPVAPSDETFAYDADGELSQNFDYDYADDHDQNQGGGKGWLIFGGLLLAGAGAIYYLFASTGGRRQRAAIQDRVGQVAQGVREQVTQDSDESGEAKVEAVAEAASQAFDRSNEKIADAPAKSNGESLPEKAVEKLGNVGDSLAGGLESAGAFLADKLEAAGTSAKGVAHSAAEKLDEVKDKTVARLDEAKTAPTTLPATTPGAASADSGAATPDAVIIEIINDEPKVGQSTEEILAEVEATVQSIENSVREDRQ